MCRGGRRLHRPDRGAGPVARAGRRQDPTGAAAERRGFGRPQHGLAALTEGVREVAFLDSDDVYTPGALQALHDRLTERPDAVGVFALAEYTDEGGVPIRPGEHPGTQLDRRRPGRIGLRRLAATADTTFADLVVYNPIWPSAVGLHRRDVLGRAGNFDVNLRRQEDWELYLRMSRHGPYAMLPERLAWYRRHAHNSTGQHLENWWYIESVRRRAWEDPANSPAQRRLLQRSARHLALLDLAREAARLRRAVPSRRWKPAWACLLSAAFTARDLCQPAPPRPSRRRVRWTRRTTGDLRARA